MRFEPLGNRIIQGDHLRVDPKRPPALSSSSIGQYWSNNGQLWSFLAGAAISSFAWGCWYTHTQRQIGKLINNQTARDKKTKDGANCNLHSESFVVDVVDDDHSTAGSASSLSPFIPQRPASLSDSIRFLERQGSSVLQRLKESCTEIMIQSVLKGEEVMKRTRWPWDRKRPKAVSEEDEYYLHLNDPYSTSLKRPSSSNLSKIEDEIPPKKDQRKCSRQRRQPHAAVCIGSIFGLDVGGSLVKLVYFEQRRDDRTRKGTKATFQSMRSSMNIHQKSRSSRSRTHQSLLGTPSSPRPLRSEYMSSNNTAPATPQKSHNLVGQFFVPSSIPSSHLHYPISPLTGPHMRQSISEPLDLSLPHPPLSAPNKSSIPYLPEAQELENDDPRSDQDIKSLVENATASQNRCSSYDAHDYIRRSQDEEVDSDGAWEYAPGLTRSASMVDMVLRHNSDKRLALDKFYKFAKSIDAAMITDENSTGVKDQHLSFYSRELGGDFHFIRFETRRMKQAMNLIEFYNLHESIHDIGATGGGAHKFSQAWQDHLGIHLEKWDELDSLVVGMQFVLSDVVGEAYSFQPDPEQAEQHHLNRQKKARDSACKEKDDHDAEKVSNETETPKPSSGIKVDEWWWSRKVKRDVAAESSSYPYLLVTIGTGVSIVRVDGPRKHERISGSTIGGGTYWGLCRLLTQVENFGDALNLALRGDPTKVDMMVGDIYGNDGGESASTLQKLGLSTNVVASSFGKLVAKADPASGLKEEDLARALLMMVTNNIGQVAYLNAQLHNTSRIYFVGNFLRQNQISQKRLAFAINFWSKGEMEALFLEHEGYFGALGAFLLSQGLESIGKISDANCEDRPRRADSTVFKQDVAHDVPDTASRHRNTTTLPNQADIVAELRSQRSRSNSM